MHNAKDERLRAKYNNDAKFLRIHKRIRESYPTLQDSALHAQLMPIKHKIDTSLLDNEHIIENKDYFKHEVTQQSKDNIQSLLDSHYNRDNRATLLHLIINEYLHQYKGA